MSNNIQPTQYRSDATASTVKSPSSPRTGVEEIQASLARSLGEPAVVETPATRTLTTGAKQLYTDEYFTGGRDLFYPSFGDPPGFRPGLPPGYDPVIDLPGGPDIIDLFPVLQPDRFLVGETRLTGSAAQAAIDDQIEAMKLQSPAFADLVNQANEVSQRMFGHDVRFVATEATSGVNTAAGYRDGVIYLSANQPARISNAIWETVNASNEGAFSAVRGMKTSGELEGLAIREAAERAGISVPETIPPLLEQKYLEGNAAQRAGVLTEMAEMYNGGPKYQAAANDLFALDDAQLAGIAGKTEPWVGEAERAAHAFLEENAQDPASFYASNLGRAHLDANIAHASSETRAPSLSRFFTGVALAAGVVEMGRGGYEIAQGDLVDGVPHAVAGGSITAGSAAILKGFERLGSGLVAVGGVVNGAIDIAEAVKDKDPVLGVAGGLETAGGGLILAGLATADPALIAAGTATELVGVTLSIGNSVYHWIWG
jgi:hypothetical protein